MEKNMQCVRPSTLTDDELSRYEALIEQPTPEWLMEINKRFFARRRSLIEASHASAQQLAFDFSVAQ